MRLKTLAISAAALVAAIGFGATPAQADHSWGSYHWARSGEATLTIYSSVTSDWSSALAIANTDWNKSPYLENRIVAGNTDSRTRRRCAMVRDAIRVCNYAYGTNGWAGLASINASGSHITQGTAKMNDSYLGNADSAKRQGVMCQEVGHDFGLGHQDENFTNPNLGTCMDYTNNWSTNQHPNQHDYDQLATIYGHSDGGAAAAAAAPGTTRIVTGNTVTIVTWAK